MFAVGNRATVSVRYDVGNMRNRPHLPKLTRRELSALLGAPAFAAGQRDASYAAELPDMLLTHLTSQLNQLAAKWDGARDGLTTAAQIEDRNRAVRAAAWKMMHGQPPRTPLAPVVVSSARRDGYRVENVMYQSRPNFWVTANLYLPDGPGPFPGILSPCGHYNDARMNPEYQLAYVNMVKAGLAVLAYDPIGQGERRQYWNPETGVTEVGGPTTEHSMAGQLLLLMGEDLTHYRVWDGMRGIDYLLARSEIDSARIGCAGHSGGGTLTMFIGAVDERVKVAVINEGGTAHRWPIELRPENRIGPSDVEQNLFPAAVLGVDLCDLHVAIAPRPLLSLIEDYSPRFNRAADHIKERYKQLGVPERFATEEATDPHSWTLKLRQSTTDWFCRWFLGKPGPEREPDFTPVPEKTLYSTVNGSIRHSGKGETIYTLMAKKRDALPAARDLAKVRAELPRLIGYTKPEGDLGLRHLAVTPRKGYRVEKVEFLSESGIYVPAWVFVGENYKPGGRAVIYVHESGKQADGLEFGRLEAMARAGELIVAIDVRGVGETRPPHAQPGDRPGEYGFLFDVETAAAYMAWYLDRSLVGMRVKDVVRAVDYTLSRTDVDPGGVRVIGKGNGAVWSLFAAALDPRIAALRCERGLLAYRELLAADRYLFNAGIFIRDVLLHFDLPQVAALLAGRELTIVDPVDHMKRRVDKARAESVYAQARQAFDGAGGGDRLRFDTLER